MRRRGGSEREEDRISGETFVIAVQNSGSNYSTQSGLLEKGEGKTVSILVFYQDLQQFFSCHTY